MRLCTLSEKEGRKELSKWGRGMTFLEKGLEYLEGLQILYLHGKYAYKKSYPAREFGKKSTLSDS